METNNGLKGGKLKGDAHSDPSGGIDAVVVTDNNRPVKLEGGEVIINKKAAELHKQELSEINQSDGDGVAIMEKGGQIGQYKLERYAIENGKTRIVVRNNKGLIGGFVYPSIKYPTPITDEMAIEEFKKEEKMNMGKGGTIASSPTKEGIEKMINQYYYSSSYHVSDDGKVIGNNGELPTVEVIQKKGRFYFKPKDNDTMAHGGPIQNTNNMRLKLGTRIHEGARQYEITELTPTQITYKEISSLQDHPAVSKSYGDIISFAKGGTISIPVFDFSNPADIDLLEREADLIQANHKIKGYEETEAKRKADEEEEKRKAKEAEALKKLNERKRKASALDLEMDMEDVDMPAMAKGGKISDNFVEGSYTTQGRKYKTKVFNTVADANKFLAHATNYGVIGVQNGKVHIALNADMGKENKKRVRVKKSGKEKSIKHS